ncbi:MULTISPECIES: MbtH family protein [unclassified Streptomyces]|uniref:MbtH family protein n=1 Tax=unclassified Streptomyces TaxID=2593676 RepID=UPI0033BDA03C
MFDDNDDRSYQVVVNDEEQYSIWPADRAAPAGWRAVGPSGPKAECLEYIDRTWTDMRPLSLRRRLAEDDADPVAV